MIDWTKPIRTKGNKKPAELLCDDLEGNGPYTYGVRYWRGTGENLGTFLGSGRFSDTGFSPYDLENVPEEPKYLPLTDEEMYQELWVNRRCVRYRGNIHAWEAIKFSAYHNHPAMVAINEGYYAAKDLKDDFVYADTGKPVAKEVGQ